EDVAASPAQQLSPNSYEGIDRRTLNDPDPPTAQPGAIILPFPALPARCNSMPAFWVGACGTDLHSHQRLAFGLVGQISTLRPRFRRSSYSGRSHRPIQDSLAP